MLIGDVNGDGKPDYAISGVTKERLYVALVIGPLSDRSRVEVLSFPLTGNSEDALCDGQRLIQMEGADFDPMKEFGQAWDGFKRSVTSKMITIRGAECDSFHLYWNHEKNSFWWFRL